MLHLTQRKARYQRHCENGVMTWQRKNLGLLKLVGLASLALACMVTQAQVPASRSVTANSFPGADIGAKINAADRSLGSQPGEIVVRDGGTIATQVVISSGHTLKLMPGTYRTITKATPILLKSGSSLVGSGWDAIVVESTAPDQFNVIGAYESSLVNGNADSGIMIRDIQVLGANSGFNSAPPAIALGNCSNCSVDHVWMNGTRSIGIAVGGASFHGHWANNVKVTNCKFTRVASQNLALVNGTNILFENNTFLAPGQKGGPGNTSIDLEPNLNTDRLENIVIRNNFIDHRKSEMGTTGNGIVVQATTGTPYVGNILVENNRIIGGENVGTITNILSNAIYVFGLTMRDVIVRNNDITRTGQAGIHVEGTRITVTDNKLTDVGGGGTPGFRVINLTNSRITGNTFTYTGQGTVDGRIVISGASSGNIYENNRGFTIAGAIR